MPRARKSVVREARVSKGGSWRGMMNAECEMMNFCRGILTGKWRNHDKK
jgi:hypothetical protein